MKSCYEIFFGTSKNIMLGNHFTENHVRLGIAVLQMDQKCIYYTNVM